VRGLPEPTAADEVRHHLRAHLGDAPGLVAAYDVLSGEVDLAPLLADLDAVARPRLAGDVVTWHVTDGSPVGPEDLDVVLVPGRLFDARGFRLGRGGGHYDRLLPRLRAGTPAIGVTVEARVVPALPTEDHDVPMTHLATESGVRVAG
jgi:hypothetical protein